MLIRRIRELLYEQGFTISGARNRLLSEGESEVVASDMPAEDVPDDNAPSVNIKQELAEIIELLQP
jgi:hypothetical protein